VLLQERSKSNPAVSEHLRALQVQTVAANIQHGRLTGVSGLSCGGSDSAEFK
jgi:hypothetical protein